MKEYSTYRIECEILEVLKQKITESKTVSHKYIAGDCFEFDNFMLEFCYNSSSIILRYKYVKSKDKSIKQITKNGIEYQRSGNSIVILSMNGFAGAGNAGCTTKWKKKWENAFGELLDVAQERLKKEKEKVKNNAEYEMEMKKQRRNAILTLIEVKQL